MSSTIVQAPERYVVGEEFVRSLKQQYEKASCPNAIKLIDYLLSPDGSEVGTVEASVFIGGKHTRIKLGDTLLYKGEYYILVTPLGELVSLSRHIMRQPRAIQIAYNDHFEAIFDFLNGMIVADPEAF